MTELRALDAAAYDWVMSNSHPSFWSRAYFKSNSKCGILLNTLWESFNSIIKGARARPILGMLKAIRVYLMMKLDSRRDWSKKQEGLICAIIQKMIEKLKEQPANFISKGAGSMKFQVCSHVENNL